MMGLNLSFVKSLPLFFDQTFANYEIIAEENDKIFEYENHVERSLVSDKVLLKQLMTILYDNALKYTEEEGKNTVCRPIQGSLSLSSGRG